MNKKVSVYQKLLSDKAFVRALDRRVTNSSDHFDGSAFLARFDRAVKKRNEWAVAMPTAKA
jgi:hypothetical protein